MKHLRKRWKKFEFFHFHKVLEAHSEGRNKQKLTKVALLYGDTLLIKEKFFRIDLHVRAYAGFKYRNDNPLIPKSNVFFEGYNKNCVQLV